MKKTHSDCTAHHWLYILISELFITNKKKLFPKEWLLFGEQFFLIHTVLEGKKTAVDRGATATLFVVRVVCHSALMLVSSRRQLSNWGSGGKAYCFVF